MVEVGVVKELLRQSIFTPHSHQRLLLLVKHIRWHDSATAYPGLTWLAVDLLLRQAFSPDDLFVQKQFLVHDVILLDRVL